jgi:glycosyltransferase involved in cell wall biosynthesis
MQKIDYSVIIPAFNEELRLPETLRDLKVAMKAVEPLYGEMIVVDNNSSDKTADIARQAGAKVVFEPHNQISLARNRGGEIANSSLLIFLDADTSITPSILKKSLHLLLSGKCYGGGIKVKFPVKIPLSLYVFTKFWNRFAAYRKWVAGCYLFCRKDAFDDVRGFREDIYAGEEIYFARALVEWGRQRGYTFGYIDSEFINTSSRKIDKYSALRLIATMLMLGSFPLLLRSRRFCSIWYRR